MQPLSDNSNTVNVPAFLGKLWTMVNDPETNHLIFWSEAENSFVIRNVATFWYELLPLYYKHNNMSSFIRQLNMYGFHKLSTVESCTMDTEKDEMQFYHPYFRKGHPELIKNIKRKVNVQKPDIAKQQPVLKQDDLAKVLTDVKNLKGRQSNVDSQLTAMKQENAILWRELAIMRQKHLKQQQIVNKLIQFLVTLVQPTQPNRMGVKRRMPLMLNEKPIKKPNNKKETEISEEKSPDVGPTIHELNNENIVHDYVSDEEEIPIVTSPQETLSAPANQNVDNLTYLLSDNIVDNAAETTENPFLNTDGKNTLLSTVICDEFQTKNSQNGNSKKENNQINQENKSSEDLSVATVENTDRILNGDDLDLHLEITQSELDQLKNKLNGFTTFDANALLGLFNDESLNYGLSSFSQLNKETSGETSSGSELTTLNNPNVIDFNELFDDSLDNASFDALLPTLNTVNNTTQVDSIETPLVIKDEPFVFK